MNELPARHRYGIAPHLRRHRRARWFHPRRGGGESHPVGGQHADEAARRGRPAALAVRARRKADPPHRRRPGAARLCPADPQAARRGVQHPAPPAHGRFGAHRHPGRLRDALPPGDPVALRRSLSAGAGRGALRHLAQPAGAQRPRPVHRHPRAGHRDRPVAAPGALRLDGRRGLLPPRPAADPAGHVQHHLLLPGLGLQRPGGGGTGLPHRLQQPQPVGAVRGGQRRPRRDRATAQPAHRQPAHPRRERGPARPALGQHHADAQPAQPVTGHREARRIHRRGLRL